MKKIIIVSVVLCSLLVGCLFVSKAMSFINQFCNRVGILESKIEECKSYIPLLFEIYCDREYESDEIEPISSVLCLGNSITWHPRKEEIEWFSEWGMAASCKEKDYCHQLEIMLKQRNESSFVTPLNIAEWELGLRSSQLDSLIGDRIKGMDAVVIRLGENVRDKNRYEMALDTMVCYCLDKVKKVVLTGVFWEDYQKELSVIKVSQRRHVEYVPLFWIDNLYDARPNRGGGTT